MIGGRDDVEASSSAPADDSTLGDGTPYESIDGLGDVAYTFTTSQAANLVVLVGDDVVVVDIVHGGGGDLGDEVAILRSLAEIALGAR